MPSRLGICQNVISGHSTGHNTVPVSVNVVQPQVPDAAADAAASTPNSLDPVSQVLPDTLQPNYTPLLPVNTILQPDPNIQDGVLPGFVWGGIDGDIFRARISESYEKVIHWKPNLFLLPCLFHALVDGSSGSQSITMKAITVLQQLLLQKPSKSSKLKNHRRHLRRRLDLWQHGDINTLLHEGQCLQARLKSKHGPTDIESIARSFGRSMRDGKVNSTLNLLKKRKPGGVLNLNATCVMC